MEKFNNERIYLPSVNEGIYTNEKEAVIDGLHDIFSFEKAEHYIDEGGAGILYRLPKGCCIKIFKLKASENYSQATYIDKNTPYEEARIQDKVSKMPYGGNTRVPRAFAVLETNTPDIKDAIIMEQLDAVNIQHIINSGELPDGFDTDTFFDDLEKFIQQMHTEAMILHNDLFPRNVMVDLHNNTPYLIDFGRSKDISKVPVQDHRKITEIDWKMVETMWDKINYLQKR